MIHRLSMLAFLTGTMIGCASASRATAQAVQSQPSQDHVAWVGQALEQMLTIKPGMTREDLLKLFTTEGGLSTGLRRTFVSRSCPYFKVDVEFHAVGRPDRDGNGRVTLVEGSQDVILKISPPYLQFSITD